MKRFLKPMVMGLVGLFAVSAMMLLGGNVNAASGSVAINDTNFPDRYFRQWVSDHCDKDKNGSLSSSEISKVTEINCSFCDIQSLDGIGFFTKLTKLDCSDNDIYHLSLKELGIANTLEWLDCSYNYLNGTPLDLDISGCTKLKYVDCTDCHMTEIDFSGIRCLEEIKVVPQSGIVSGNNKICLKKLDVSGCTSLKILELTEEAYMLSELSIVRCSALESFSFQGRDEYSQRNEAGNTEKVNTSTSPITSIDFTDCLSLDSVTITRSNISVLDLDGNVGVTSIKCSGNMNLTTINAVNGHMLGRVRLEDNPKLTTLNIFTRALTSFELSGEIGLSTLTLNNCNKLTGISVYNSSPMSLVINNASALESISIKKSQINSVSLSGCNNMVSVTVTETNIKSINLSGMTKLNSVYVYQNPLLTSIDLSGCTELRSLKVTNNKLTSLNISSCPNIGALECEGNSITKLDIRNNSVLLNVYNNCDAITNNGVTYWTYYGDGVDGGYFSVDQGVQITPAKNTNPTSTPKPATPTPKPSSSSGSSSGSGSSASSESGVAGFVERLYSVALNRQSDPNGKADWVNRIKTGEISGAEAARGFFLSPEFVNFGLSNEEYLNRLYHTFFDRAPDEGGYNNWMTILAGGASRESVLDGFINSTEWANLCLTFGIASGGNGVPDITVEPNEQVVGFATRLYTTCLGRNPDGGGLSDWASQLANMKISGSVAAHGFFFSTEFVDANHSDEEYVTRLYRTFMGREPDQAGFDNWINALSSGQSREFVFQGFAGSAEWAGICADYGILK